MSCSPTPFRVTMILQRFRPHFTGQGVQVEEICRVLAPLGVEATVVTSWRGGARFEPAGSFAIERVPCAPPWTSRPSWPYFAISIWKALWRRRDRIDLVHVHGVTDALYAAWLFCRLHRIPLLLHLTLVGADDPGAVRDAPRRLRRLRWAIYRRCDGYVAMSPALARRYVAAGLCPERLREIPQGVDVTRFSPGDRRAARVALGFDPEEPLLVFVGSLVERKGVDLLLAGFARVQASLPRARLLLVGPEGESGTREFFERHLRTLPAPARERVVRYGTQDRPERFLRAADVFVFPSRREGFGTALAEAMACGLACVATELPGITDFLFGAADGGNAGVIVPPEDPEALAKAVLDLLADPDRAASLGRAARRRAIERFSMDSVATQLLALYRDLSTSTRMPTAAARYQRDSR